MYTAEIDRGISIKEVAMEDASVIFRAIDRHREYLKIWLPFVVYMKEVKDEEDFLSSVLAVPAEEREWVFKIEKGDEFCGLIGFRCTDKPNRRTEIGYWLLPEYQGKGVMTKCVRHLCQWAFEQRGMNRIQIKCAVGNFPSNAIPKRLGFRFEGIERDGELLASGEYTDINVYSLLKKDTKQECPPMHIEDVIITIKNSLSSITCDKLKNLIFYDQTRQRSIINEFQTCICNKLKTDLPYIIWETEHRINNINKDSIDIYGNCYDLFHIIIELDKPRADQVAKKMLSRIACFRDNNIIYIAICYPGTEKMNSTECIKYWMYGKQILEKMNTNSLLIGCVINDNLKIEFNE